MLFPSKFWMSWYGSLSDGLVENTLMSRWVILLNQNVETDDTAGSLVRGGIVVALVERIYTQLVLNSRVHLLHLAKVKHRE